MSPPSINRVCFSREPLTQRLVLWLWYDTAADLAVPAHRSFRIALALIDCCAAWPLDAAGQAPALSATTPSPPTTKSLPQRHGLQQLGLQRPRRSPWINR